MFLNEVGWTWRTGWSISGRASPKLEGCVGRANAPSQSAELAPCRHAAHEACATPLTASDTLPHHPARAAWGIKPRQQTLLTHSKHSLGHTPWGLELPPWVTACHRKAAWQVGCFFTFTERQAQSPKDTRSPEHPQRDRSVHFTSVTKYRGVMTDTDEKSTL